MLFPKKCLLFSTTHFCRNSPRGVPKRGPLGAPQISTRYTVANETHAPKATPIADSFRHAVRGVGLERPHGKRLRLVGGPTPTSLKLLLILLHI